MSHAAAMVEIRSSLRRGRLGAVARVGTPHTIVALEAWWDRHGAELNGQDAFFLIMPASLEGAARTPPDETLRYFSTWPNVRLIRIMPYGSVRRYRLLTLRRLLGSLSLPALLGARARGDAVHLLSGRYRDVATLLDVGPREFARRGVVFEILDEGFGGMPSGHWDTPEVELQRAFRTLMVSRMPARTHYLLIDATKSAAPNVDVVDSYRRVMTRHRVDTALPSTARPRALVLTSYMSEVNFRWSSVAAEQRACDHAIRQLDAKGYAVLLKPHPREDPAKYADLPSAAAAREFVILDASVAAEAYASLMSPDDIVVAVALSNALFTAKVLFDLKVFLLPASETGFPTDVGERKYYRVFADGLPLLSEVPAVAERADAPAEDAELPSP